MKYRVFYKAWDYNDDQKLCARDDLKFNFGFMHLI